MYANWNEFIRLHPRNEPQETPIDVVKEQKTDYFGHPYTSTEIKPVDNAS